MERASIVLQSEYLLHRAGMCGRDEALEVKGQAETHHVMTHRVHNINSGRKRCISVTIFLKK